MTRPLAAIVLIGLTGCFRTRIERRDVPVDTGIVLTFGDEQGTPLAWDFGDGSPKVVAPLVKKAFARPGHYTVRGTEGATLRWQVDLDAVPRPVTRALPADAEWAIYSPQLEADFLGSLDFLEHVLGPTNLQGLIDGWVLPGLEEGRLLTGERSAEGVAAHYRQLGAKLVVVKLGPEGAYFDSDTAGRGHVAGFPVEKVVDTVGAGDGFAVGVISALLEGRSVVDAVKRGAWIGACAVQVRGDTEGLPTRAELSAAGL